MAPLDARDAVALEWPPVVRERPHFRRRGRRAGPAVRRAARSGPWCRSGLVTHPSSVAVLHRVLLPARPVRVLCREFHHPGGVRVLLGAADAVPRVCMAAHSERTPPARERRVRRRVATTAGGVRSSHGHPTATTCRADRRIRVPGSASSRRHQDLHGTTLGPSGCVTCAVRPVLSARRRVSRDLLRADVATRSRSRKRPRASCEPTRLPWRHRREPHRSSGNGTCSSASGDARERWPAASSSRHVVRYRRLF